MGTLAAPSPRSRSFGRAGLGVAMAVLAVSSPVPYVIARGEDEIARSTAALRAKDPTEAIGHARRALAWYVPLAPHVRVARERLVALAREAERRGQSEVALSAWRAVRQGARSARTALPSADASTADEAIATLLARTDQPAQPVQTAQPPSPRDPRGAEAGRGVVDARRFHQRELEASGLPGPLAGGAAGLCALGLCIAAPRAALGLARKSAGLWRLALLLTVAFSVGLVVALRLA
jgi:hypothetical protein